LGLEATSHGFLVGLQPKAASEGVTYGLIGPRRPYVPVLTTAGGLAADRDRLATVNNPTNTGRGRAALLLLRLQPNGKVEELARDMLPWPSASVAAFNRDAAILFVQGNGGPEAWLWATDTGVRRLPVSPMAITLQSANGLVTSREAADDCLVVFSLDRADDPRWRACGYDVGYISASARRLVAMRAEASAVVDVVDLARGGSCRGCASRPGSASGR
jgi:hypothetical protein